MIKKKIYYCLICLFTLTSIQIQAQNREKGVFSGSFESNNQIYRDDDKTGAKAPKDKFGSNNYLRLNYNYGKFTAGIQYEAYLPPLQGYSAKLEDNGIVHRFLTYQNDQLEITVGNFYEQFGSGLLFRAWEDRQLGLNNALEGINIRFRPFDYLTLKAVYGKQRKYFENGKGRIRGVDGEVNLMSLLNSNSPTTVLLGGSFLNRYQDYTGPVENYPASVDAWSGRLDINSGWTNLQVEYVRKGKDGIANSNAIIKEGNALLVNNSYTAKGFGLNLSFRRLENMTFRSEREALNNELLVNYLPANTKQHKYSLANIYPYATQAKGEIGGQIDLFYTFRKGSSIGGKYGTRFAINLAQYKGLQGNRNANGYYTSSDFLSWDGQTFYRDINVEMDKKWSKRFKSYFSYINLQYNKNVIEGGNKGLIKAHIAVADLQYKLRKGHALRTELQHLWTLQDEKEWLSGTLEYTLGSKWAFFVSDMYNYGKTDIHYVNAGGSYVKNTTRLSVSYGRQREGLLCVGGVCRLVPAATGLRVSLTTSF
ncbi:MAG: DUF6029 family protein [Marinifilaceae bacterium]